MAYIEFESISVNSTFMCSLTLSELVHGDDPERCYGEGGGRGVHVWERMQELKILKLKKNKK